MDIPGSKLIMTILIGTVFAACSPTREEMRLPSVTDFDDGHQYVIDNILYRAHGMRGDTLVFMRSARPSQLARGPSRCVRFDEALIKGLDRTEVIVLEYRPGATMLTSGDTAFVPMQSLDSTFLYQKNPTYVAGVAIVEAASYGVFGILTVFGVTYAATLTVVWLLAYSFERR